MPGTSGVYPVKNLKDKVIWHVAKNEDQPVSRFQIPLVPGLSSTIHVAQGTEMFPIICNGQPGPASQLALLPLLL